MSEHRITIEVWGSEKDKHAGTKATRCVRWTCACGRLGPGVTFDDGGEQRAWKTAQRGGDNHVSRWTR